jgi:hypothetical protein
MKPLHQFYYIKNNIAKIPKFPLPLGNEILFFKSNFIILLSIKIKNTKKLMSICFLKRLISRIMNSFYHA